MHENISIKEERRGGEGTVGGSEGMRGGKSERKGGGEGNRKGGWEGRVERMGGESKRKGGEDEDGRIRGGKEKILGGKSERKGWEGKRKGGWEGRRGWATATTRLGSVNFTVFKSVKTKSRDYGTMLTCLQLLHQQIELNFRPSLTSVSSSITSQKPTMQQQWTHACPTLGQHLQQKCHHELPPTLHESDRSIINFYYSC